MMHANCCLVTDPAPSQAQPALCPKTVRDSRTPESDVGTGRLGLSSTRRLAEEKH